MIVSNVLSLIVLCICIIIIYNRYSPKIDIIISRDTYIVLLWYNKKNQYDDGYKRAYVQLFKVNRKLF